MNVYSKDLIWVPKGKQVLFYLFRLKNLVKMHLNQYMMIF